MTRSSAALALLVAVALPSAAFVSAQTSRTSTPTTPSTRVTTPAARPAQPTAAQRSAAATAKSGFPDPALFDGSAEKPEKRPDRGMLAEFEMPGGEQPSERVGGPAGGSPGGDEQQQGQGGGGSREQSAAAASRGAVQNDPNAKAEGASAENLNIPEGAQADASAAAASKPKEVSLGDAAMQIQTAANQQNTVGGQQQQAATNTQQYEKGAAQGNQKGDNNNRGVERGQNVPAGL